jgi:RNA polymerase sigma factor (sigma-70 family)
VAPVEEELLDLDEALARLGKVEKRAAELVNLRVFAGMKLDEAARALGISPRTAKRDWAYARAWLRREMEKRTNHNS